MVACALRPASTLFRAPFATKTGTRTRTKSFVSWSLTIAPVEKEGFVNKQNNPSREHGQNSQNRQDSNWQERQEQRGQQQRGQQQRGPSNQPRGNNESARKSNNDAGGRQR